jgi:hypothetical protein
MQPNEHVIIVVVYCIVHSMAFRIVCTEMPVGEHYSRFGADVSRILWAVTGR